MKSKYLKVKIKHFDQDIVNLTFPIYSLNILNSIMPENVLKLLGERNISLESIVEKAELTDFCAQELFLLEKQNKTYQVWIE